MVVIVSLTKTLTATANNGGPSTWTSSATYPAKTGGVWTSQGYSGSKTVEIYANEVTTDYKKTNNYILKPASKTGGTLRPSEVILIDTKKLMRSWVVQGYLTDNATANAIEQGFILQAMAEEIGNMTFHYRGADYTQVAIDDIILTDQYESESQTGDTTYQMDTNLTKYDEGKLQIKLTLTQAVAR